MFVCLFFLAPYARTTRYEEAFLPEGKKRPRSLRSLGLAMLNHTNKQIKKQINKHPWYRKIIVFIVLFLAPYARTTRCEEAFLPEGKKRSRSLRSLDMTSIPRAARYVVRNQAETAEDAEGTGEHHRIPQHAIVRFFPDFVLFDGFIYDPSFFHSRAFFLHVNRLFHNYQFDTYISSNGKSKSKCWYT